ncbi:hypothetical protein Athai_01240 [Actinocatenispora thailandica]|uniref:Uncharacterized protein n=1 Tax=Actinocatenispora thailandica TaxID=227318 RepID=A0A7R7DJC6_9ACTN|nr:hypothetical protein [Actinocatenispora thailandica]BCJ32621.1 hypothetical protein Athai_01240 [Actinocatenispora thailandica]
MTGTPLPPAEKTTPPAAARPGPPPVALTVLVAAPAVWFFGWVIMRMRTDHGPGAAWTTAHSLWIVAFAMFGVGCVGLARLAGRRSVALVAATAVALAGALLTTVQMVLDLIVGLAPTAAAMDARYDTVFAVPGVRLVFYTLAPVVFYVGLLALLVLAAVRRTAPVALVVLAGCGILASGIGHGLPGLLRLVEGGGALLILGALAGIVRTRRGTAAG